MLMENVNKFPLVQFAFENGCEESVIKLRQVFSTETIHYKDTKVETLSTSELKLEIEKLFPEYISFLFELDQSDTGNIFFFVPSQAAINITKRLICATDETSDDEILSEINDVLGEIMNILANPLIGQLSRVSSVPLTTNLPKSTDKKDIFSKLDKITEEIIVLRFQVQILEDQCELILFFPKSIF